MGNLSCVAFGRCPVIPKLWNMFCVCPYSWHLGLLGEDTACLSGTWQEWLSLLWLSCSPCAVTTLTPFNTPRPERSASHPVWWHGPRMGEQDWHDHPLAPHWGPSASCRTCGPVPGFAWTEVFCTLCISQRVAEMGNSLLLRRAWSWGSHHTPGRKVGGPCLCAPHYPPQTPRCQSRLWPWPSSILPTQRCSFGRGQRVTVL